MPRKRFNEQRDRIAEVLDNLRKARNEAQPGEVSTVEERLKKLFNARQQEIHGRPSGWPVAAK